MKKSKKSVVGHVLVWMLLNGVKGKINRDLNVKTVIFSSLRNDPNQKLENRFIWFKKWVLERQTFATLSRDSGLLKDTLQRIFYYFLGPKF